MKINGPGQPPASPEPSAAETADKAAKREGASGTSEVSSGAKAFSEKLAGSGGVGKAGAPQAATATPRTGAVPVSDLAADLRAGKLTPAAAVDKVVDRVVAQQVGPDAPPAVRESVRAALQDALDSDPTLAEKLSQLR